MHHQKMFSSPVLHCKSKKNFTMFNRPFYSCLHKCPGLWMAPRLEATLFGYRPHCFCCVNQIFLMLTMSIYMTRTERSVSYQSKVTSSLADIQRPAPRADNSNMVYSSFLFLFNYLLYIHPNKPFPNCLLPLFQNKSKCKIHLNVH